MSYYISDADDIRCTYRTYPWITLGSAEWRKRTPDAMSQRIGKSSSPSIIIVSLCSRSWRLPRCIHSITKAGSARSSMTAPMTVVIFGWRSLDKIRISLMKLLRRRFRESVLRNRLFWCLYDAENIPKNGPLLLFLVSLLTNPCCEPLLLLRLWLEEIDEIPRCSLFSVDPLCVSFNKQTPESADWLNAKSNSELFEDLLRPKKVKWDEGSPWLWLFPCGITLFTATGVPRYSASMTSPNVPLPRISGSGLNSSSLGLILHMLEQDQYSRYGSLRQ